MIAVLEFVLELVKDILLDRLPSLFCHIFKFDVKQLWRCTLHVSKNGDILDKKKFLKFVEKTLKKSENLANLRIKLERGDIDLDRVQPSFLELFESDYEKGERRIEDIFYLLLSKPAKKEWVVLHKIKDSDVPQILMKAIALFFVEAEPNVSEVAVDCVNVCIKSQRLKKFFCVTNIKESLLLEEIHKLNSYRYVQNVGLDLFTFGILVGDIADSDWYINSFLPSLLCESVLKLENNEIKSNDFNFCAFYSPFSWQIGLH